MENLLKKYCEGRELKSIEPYESGILIRFEGDVALVIKALGFETLDIKVGRYKFIEHQD